MLLSEQDVGLVVFTCLQAGFLWGCSAAHLSRLPGNSQVHLCSLTHILAHGLTCKITLMHMNSWLFNPWGRIAALLFPGLHTQPCPVCLWVTQAGLSFTALLELMKWTFEDDRKDSYWEYSQFSENNSALLNCKKKERPSFSLED